METLKEIEARAARRHGGARALAAELPEPRSRAALRRVGDDRWLAALTRGVFQAGFVWKIVEAKWPGFEEAFSGFDPTRVSRLSERKLSALAKDSRVIRNPQKIAATRDNARLIVELSDEYGSAARCFADWPETDIVGLWDLLKRRGSRLGGLTGPMALRHVGKDTPLLLPHVLLALREQGVVTQKSPASARALAAIQQAFNAWREESGRSLSEISKILACSVEG